MNQTRPNILFLFPDTHRGDWMPYAPEVFDRLGLEQPAIRMPQMERLMADGMTFTHAMTPSPLCAPARACLASGLRYDKCGVADNAADYPLNQRTFYSVLKQTGYSVGGVGKFDLHKATHWWGLDGWIDDLGTLGFTEGIDNAGKIDAIISGKTSPKDPYMKFLYDRGLAQLHIEDMSGRGNCTDPTELPEDAYCDNWLTQNGIRMLRDFPADKPWFLQVNFTGPHGPWDITREMKQAWEEAQLPGAAACSLDAAQINAIRQNYAAMLENIDRNIGMLLDEVRKRGEWENTYVVYASDHGDMLGDLDKFGKCLPERGSVSVPLVVRGPGVRPGAYSEAMVELQDLAGTFVDWAGGTMPEAIDAISLGPVLAGQAKEHRTYQVSELCWRGRHWKMAADRTHKLIREEDSGMRLYDLSDDPMETRDVAAQTEAPAHLLACLEPLEPSEGSAS